MSSRSLAWDFFKLRRHLHGHDFSDSTGFPRPIQFPPLDNPHPVFKWVEKRCMNSTDLAESMQLCTKRHPFCSIPRGYLIASALLP